MSTAKKKTNSKDDPVLSAIDAAGAQFVTAADQVKEGLDAALDASAEQARAACAFEGVEFAGREHVDAAMQAGEAYYAGLKGLSDLWFKSAKEAAQFQVDAAKSLTACKTPEDLSQAQLKIATGGIEAAMASANTLGEAAAKTAGDVTGSLKTPFAGPFAQFWGKNAA